MASEAVFWPRPLVLDVWEVVGSGQAQHIANVALCCDVYPTGSAQCVRTHLAVPAPPHSSSSEQQWLCWMGWDGE
jgi:hypothetical protein